MCCASCTNSHDLCILGYTTAPQYVCHIHTIHVPIFKNETFVRGLEFELTEAVIKQIEQTTPWKVVQHDNADAILTGKIVALSKRVIIHNQLNEIRDGELALGVELDFKDLRAPPSIDPLEPMERTPGGRRRGDVERNDRALGDRELDDRKLDDRELGDGKPGDRPRELDERQPKERDELALPGMKRRGRHGDNRLNFVETNATFIPELGESYATARQRAVNELAKQIVGMLEVPW